MSDFVAFGGTQYNAPGGTINVTTPPEVLSSLATSLASLSQLSAGQQAEIGRLSDLLAASEGIVRQVLATLGEHPGAIRPEDLPARVAELVAERRHIHDRQADRPPDPDAALAALDRSLTEAMASGDDTRAQALLEQRRDLKLAAARLRAEAVERLRAAQARDLAEAAESETSLGELALVRLQYRDAAARFKAAAELLPEDEAHQSARWRLQERAADALYRQGVEFGDNAALAEAIADLRAKAAASAGDPRERAIAAYNLATSLQALGARESDPARLEEAVGAYREALEAWPDADAAWLWRVLNNLGNAFTSLGERATDTERLEQAVAAFTAALEEPAEAPSPADRALTLGNLAGVLRTLGERDSGTERLEQAAGACLAGLAALGDEGDRLRWASVQNTLGLVMARLGYRKRDPAGMEMAVEAFQAALGEQRRERVPLDWAMTQMNLGLALTDLGEMENSPARLEEAVAACRASLEERTRARVPLDWGRSQVNLGRALWQLGLRTGRTELQEQAARAFAEGLETLTREQVPLDWALAQNLLGNAYSTLGQRAEGTELLEAAAAAYRAALEVQTRDRVPLQWATTRTNLAIVLAVAARRTGGSPAAALAEIAAAQPVFAAVGATDDAAWAESLRQRIAEG